MKGEILIESSLLSSVRSPLSFICDSGEEQNLELVCDWTPSGETWVKSPEFDECPWDGCRESIPTEEEKDTAAYSVPLDQSQPCLELSAVEVMSNSTPKSNDHVYRRRKLQSESKMNRCVYRRRKLHNNSVAFFQAQTGTDGISRGDGFLSTSSEWVSMTERRHDQSCSQIKRENADVRTSVLPAEVYSQNHLDSGSKSISVKYCPLNGDDVLSTETKVPTSMKDVSRSDSINDCSIQEEQEFVVASVTNVRKSALESFSSTNDSCSSSKSNMAHDSVFIKIDEDDTPECSSSDIVATELFGRSSLGKELSVSARACASGDIVDVDGDGSHLCKVCGASESPFKMLICDLCEEAFHLSCCNPRVKMIPVDEWYCQTCIRKKPKPLLGTTGKPSDIMTELSGSRYRKKASRSDPISFMLKDKEPYASGVRIGKAFQAAVPDWSGPISNDFASFGEPLEMDHAECVGLNNSIGNWLQCREVIYDNAGDGGEGIICGKWRRAPLFEVQTDDWDCSCAVLWDPIHSDCAVPQELRTDEVMMHLKYIQLLRPRLAGKRCNQTRTKSDGSV